MRGQTIQIYLPDGNPRSVKVCNLRDSIVSALLIPRAKFKEFSNRDELQKAGVYFLIGDNEDSPIPEIYIGESEVLLDRLRNHNTNKDFWNYLICFTSDSDKNTLNKVYVKYLESIAIEFAEKINKCSLQQGKSSSKPKLSDSDRDFVLSVFDHIKILMSALGYPIFDAVKQDKKNIFFCKIKDIIAEGEYTSDGFIVFEGSKAKFTDSYNNYMHLVNLRKELIDKGILKKENDYYILTKNYTFNSPSQASAMILGRNSNGWNEWKDSKGETLDSRFRN